MYSKYNSRKVKCSQGHIHDSKKEAQRCNELTFLEKAGEITNLRQQVKYTLIPTQKEFTSGLITKGKNKGQPKTGKTLEKECSYYADFDYYTADGEHVVEDVKGYKGSTAYTVFKIKKKLMLYFHNIQVREV
jgi:hypothetical protein